MRFHIRRLVLFALCSTCTAVILLNVLRPSDVDLVVPLVEIQQRQDHPASLDERLARYSFGGGRNNNVTASVQQIFRSDLSLFTVQRWRTSSPQAAAPVTYRDEEILEDQLMSEKVPGSQNEHVRRQLVHLPEYSKSGGETIWWNSLDDHPNDRIEVQMRFVPRNYRRADQKLKVIYLPEGLGNEPEGQEKFITEQCPVNSCRLTADRSVALTAEMRLLQSNAFFQFIKKPAGQIWTMFLLESPANTGNYPYVRDLINWTATYRWDSTIVTPYEKFVPYRNASWSHEQQIKRHRYRRSTVADSESNATRRNYAAGKTKMVAWFVSNCGPKNSRNEYANELAKYALFFFLISIVLIQQLLYPQNYPFPEILPTIDPSPSIGLPSRTPDCSMFSF